MGAGGEGVEVERDWGGRAWGAAAWSFSAAWSRAPGRGCSPVSPGGRQVMQTNRVDTSDQRACREGSADATQKDDQQARRRQADRPQAADAHSQRVCRRSDQRLDGEQSNKIRNEWRRLGADDRLTQGVAMQQAGDR